MLSAAAAQTAAAASAVKPAETTASSQTAAVQAVQPAAAQAAAVQPSAAAAQQPSAAAAQAPAAPAQPRSSASQGVKKDALLLYQNGDYASAITTCETEIATNPTSVESYVVLCWSLVKNKQYAESEQRASDGLKVSPYDLRLIEVLGESKYYLGKNNGALEQFQKYVANAPESGARVGAAYYYMGEIYIRQARYQHADISLSAAVKKEPLLDRWWTRLGYAREMAGNYYESVAAYDEALRLNSSSADALTGKNRVSAKLQ
jgi:tetratricopeptide (TPR) repeat protein